MDTTNSHLAGGGVLGEIEETSLDETISALRASLTSTTLNASHSATGPSTTRKSTRRGDHLPRIYPIPELDHLATRHFRATGSTAVEITGHHEELLYYLLATLLAPPHSYAVILIDLDGRFDVTRLLEYRPYAASLPACKAPDSSTNRGHQGIVAGIGHAIIPEDAATPAQTTSTPNTITKNWHVLQRPNLEHLRVYRCPTITSSAQARAVVAAAEHHMVYGTHGSREREWWGTVLVGSVLSSGSMGDIPADVKAGWKGWMRVDREETPPLRHRRSVDEVMADGDRQFMISDRLGWVAKCPWGEFRFGGD